MYITNYQETTNAETVKEKIALVKQDMSIHASYVYDYLSRHAESDRRLEMLVCGNETLSACVAAALCKDVVGLGSFLNHIPELGQTIEFGRYGIKDSKHPLHIDLNIICYYLTVTINHITHRFDIYATK